MKIRPPRAICELCGSRSTHVIEWDLLERGVDAQGQIAHCGACTDGAWAIVPFGAKGAAKPIDGTATQPTTQAAAQPATGELAKVIDITERLRSA